MQGAFEAFDLRQDEARVHLATTLARAACEADVTAAVAAWAAPAAGAVFANTAILDPATNQVRAFHPASLAAPIAARWTAFPLGSPTPLCEAILTGYPVLLPDLVSISERFPELTADTVASGLQATASVPLRDRRGSSIGALGFAWAEPQPFSPQQLSRLALLSELAAQALEAVRRHPGRPRTDTGHDSLILQEALLPTLFPDCPGLEVAAAYLPANDAPMGGDWYDVFPVDSLSCLVIGDVSGHGAEAAAAMAELRHAVRAFADEDPEPASVVTRLNRFACRQVPDAAATLIVAVWDPVERLLRRCNAGHPPILRCRFDEYSFLAPAGGPQLMIGVDPGHAYGEEAKELRPGTTLLMYTDGLIERPRQHLEDGMSSLLAFTEQHPNLSPRMLVDEILLWRLRQGPCSDDLGLLAVRLG
jgi:hypothetical protein